VIAEIMKGAEKAPPDQLQEMIRGVKAGAFSGSLAAGIVAVYLKAALCAAFTLFVSTFASSWIFTIIVSVIVYLIGHVQATAREYWLAANSPSIVTKSFLALVSLFFPDLQLFNLVDDIVAGNSIQLILFWKMVALGVLYICVYLLASYFVFAKKEL
jgi:hypothetical protein